MVNLPILILIFILFISDENPNYTTDSINFKIVQKDLKSVQVKNAQILMQRFRPTD